MSQVDESQFEVLRELWKITEMRDGAVYKTEYVEDQWVTMGEDVDSEGYVYCVKSTSFEGRTIRRKSKV